MLLHLGHLSPYSSSAMGINPTALARPQFQTLDRRTQQSELPLETPDVGDARSSNGEMANSNVIQAADTPIHTWYRFVQSYPPHLVRKYTERFNLSAATLILDPFCGTGTTLVEAKLGGLPSIGCDA